jgi:lactate dehydrogenase-like 2-hydroxyacid dehydrogenase
MPIYEPVVAQLEREFTLHKLWSAADRERYVRESCAGVRAIVTGGAKGLPPGFIDGFPKLELIACFGNPHGTIDHAAAGKRGIVVTNTPDDIIGTVAELGAGMAVALMRRIVVNDRFARSGQWEKSAPTPGNALIGKTAGIVGLGRIGRQIAKRLEAFEMAICYQGPRQKSDVPYRYFADPTELARASDCLVITCWLSAETHGLIDARVLEALGPEGFLVNVARGPIVDERALVSALEEKRIAGAALDVFWDEPRVPRALMDLENVVLLPHVGSTTVEIREERARKLMANLHAHFSGKPVLHRCTS